MNRKTYLKELEKELRNSYSERQMQDILADYTDFFDAGAAEGKSEAELCTEFGPPKQAAWKMKSENGMTDSMILSKIVNIICIILWLAVIVVWEFLRGTTVHLYPPFVVSASQSHGNFWIATSFPLALEGIFAIRFFWGSPAKKGLNWVPRIQIVLFIPIATVLAFLIYFSFLIQSAQGLNFIKSHRMIMDIASWGRDGSILLLVASGVLFILYAVHGHPKACRFLFLDTTLLTLFLNLPSIFCDVAANFNAAAKLASCILRAVLPNLTAAIFYMAIQRNSLLRKKITCATEKTSINTVCMVLSIFLTVVFFGIDFYFLRRDYLNFWPALLFPLALQSVVSLWLSTENRMQEKIRRIPLIQIILFALIAAALGITIYFTFFIEQFENKAIVSNSLSSLFFGSFTIWVIRVAVLLLIASGILFIRYAIHGHPKARWFLFVDSTLILVFFNFIYGLSNISYHYYGINVVGCSFFFAAMPNLVAAIAFLISQKIHHCRRETAWTAR